MSDEWVDPKPLHTAAERGDLARVRELVGKGQDVNEFEEDLAWTPLHSAAKGGHIEVMQCLIEAGADVNAHDESKIGETPLGLVAAECSYEVALVLIEAGADPTIQGWMHITALDRAEKRKSPEGRSVHGLLLETARRKPR